MSVDTHGQTPIPPEELAVFRQLKDIWVVVDVGARTDTNYLEIKPHTVQHLFESHPDFFQVLKDKVGDNHNVHLNNYGLGDVEGVFSYNEGLQAMQGGEACNDEIGLKFEIRTLDSYTKENNITRIDFLKVDAEGYDYKVLLGAQESLKFTRYIQYEYWNNKQQYHDLLENDFEMHYIGGRNVLSANKQLVSQMRLAELTRFFIENNYRE